MDSLRAVLCRLCSPRALPCVLQPGLEGSTVATTSFTQPPPGAHLTHRGVRSDTTGSCVPAEMLFYHGPEYQKTSYATLNELILSDPVDGKPNVNAVLADPNPASKPSTYKVLPAAPKANWQTTYSTELKDVSATAEKATKGRSQLFTKEFDHGTLFPQNNPFRDQ